ncbi:MAG: hypothetical protein CUN54_03600 [Phototrophicales bacterium]|nr:MAG: hypothetical protein CUN54_03600 [Phototrophicales bacterium]
MNKRERLEKTIAGMPTDRVPVALWRHWPGDDQRPADLAYSIIEYQQLYDWDFVNVLPAESFCVIDYGVQDEWCGAADGRRKNTRRVVERSLQWTDLRPLEGIRGTLGRHVEGLRIIAEAFTPWDDPPPVVQTILSPLAQAELLAGRDVLMQHIRTRPDRLRTGLNTITESTLRFINAIRRLPVDGIFYVSRHANYSTMPESEYQEFGLPYDQKILEGLPERWWLNMLHLEGDAPMFRLMSQLPAQVINWADHKEHPTLDEAKAIFNGAVCGGLSRWEHLHQGTPAIIRDVAKAAMFSTRNHRFILSAGGPTMITSPLSNIRAVRQVVDEVRVM